MTTDRNDATQRRAVHIPSVRSSTGYVEQLLELEIGFKGQGQTDRSRWPDLPRPKRDPRERRPAVQRRGID